MDINGTGYEFGTYIRFAPKQPAGLESTVSIYIGSWK